MNSTKSSQLRINGRERVFLTKSNLSKSSFAEQTTTTPQGQLHNDPNATMRTPDSERKQQQQQQQPPNTNVQNAHSKANSNTVNGNGNSNSNQFSLININQVHTYTLGRCGYCQNTKWMTSGFDCEQMALNDYQLLMDRGWRRCGTYFYKPHVDFCCCRTYTIRLNGREYKPGSSQKKVLRKFDKMLNKQDNEIFSSIVQTPSKETTPSSNVLLHMNEEDEDEDFLEDEEDDEQDFGFNQQRSMSLPQNSNGKNLLKNGTSEENSESDTNKTAAAEKAWRVLNMDIDMLDEIKEKSWKVLLAYYESLKNNAQALLELLELNIEDKQNLLLFDDRIIDASRIYQNKNMIKHGTHSTNILITFFRMNLHTWGDELKSKEVFFEKTNSFFQSALDTSNQELMKLNVCLKLHNTGEIKVHCLKRSFLKRVSGIPGIKQQKIKDGESMQSITSSFTTASSKKKPISFIIPDRRKNFERKVCKANFDEESYELYKRYNKIIHNNMKSSKESYKNFLCVNGLRSSSVSNAKGKVLEYGCFHFRYYLDQQLVAVSVVDILPDGLSSVYYFYEPDLKKYSLGVIGNLRDIDYIKEMTVHFPNFRYYYLGFYIHNNQKMSYKASYKPFELLCPITYRWVVCDRSSEMQINENESPRLCMNSEIIDDMEFDSIDTEKYVQQKVKLYISGRYIKINQIKQSFITYFNFLLQKLVTLLGKQLSESLVFGQQ